MKQALVYILVFSVVGEILVRFDESFEFLEEKRIIRIKTDIEVTEEYRLLQDTSFSFNDEDLKIMVLGDSYIFGGGINFEDNFSQNLKRLVNVQQGAYNHGWVLDLSRPSANNLDHHISYFEFVDPFKPDIVVLGYNNDDITGNLKIEQNEQGQDFNMRKMSSDKNKSFIRMVYDILYTSEFVHFIFHSVHKELKANGIIIKGSLIDTILKSYWQDKENWKASRRLLEEIILHAGSHGIQIIVYKFPEINLINNPQLFVKSDKAIKEFFDNYPTVHFINGTESFKDKDSRKYRLSKYDGHPNELAHKEMVDEVFSLIVTTNYKCLNVNFQAHEQEYSE